MDERIKAIFDETVARLTETGIPHKTTVDFSIKDAEERLRHGLEYYCGKEAVWNEEYQPVTEWLSNNEERGILISGYCGTGKTLICCRIIPVLLYSGADRLMSYQCHATELGERLTEMMKHKVAIIDDIGTEDKYQSYGNKHYPFIELVDNAERKGNLIIATTNLNTEHLSLKYGQRTVDRLRALTKLVTFTGKSLRK